MKALILLTALAFTGTCTTAGAVGGTMEIRTLESGGHASAEQAGAVAASDEATYRRTWETSVRGGEPPAVDFQTESAVFLFAGMRRTGGYSIEVRGATLEGETLTIDAVVKGPKRGDIVTQALTHPFAVIAVKSRGFKDVRWQPEPQTQTQ